MTIWKENITFESLKQRSQNTMASHLNIQFTEIGDDFLQATMPVDERTIQPLGLLNGGASCALAETVASTAANYCVDQSKYYCIGLEINANHLKPATQDSVTACASPIHIGKKTHVWQIKIYNHKKQLSCIVRHTIMVIERKKTI